MIKVYYDTNSQELLTEQEANDKAFEITQRDEYSNSNTVF